MEASLESARPQRNNLSDDLFYEVLSATTRYTLSDLLKTNLESLNMTERKEIVSITGVQWFNFNRSPLFIACENENLKMVEYLIETCGADVEQKGTCWGRVYDCRFRTTPDPTCDVDGSFCVVTPLWNAAVHGRLKVVKCLVNYGANANTVNDSGYTALHIACLMHRYDVVHYLVEQAGANINQPDHGGRTCLISSVQNSTLCEYLLSHGADVNVQNNQLKTALHYAIEERLFDTTKLLIAYGADPFLKNQYGNDAFQISCLKAAPIIFAHLLAVFPSRILRERKAQLHELMGSTFFDEHHDIQMALKFWREAIDIRYDPKRELPDLPKMPLECSLSYPTLDPRYMTVLFGRDKIHKLGEFNTKDELDNIRWTGSYCT